MNQEQIEYLLNKISTNPVWLQNVFMSSISKEISKAHSRLHQESRGDNLSRINYAQGYLEGCQIVENVLRGIQNTERQTESLSKLPVVGDRKSVV